MSDVLILRGEEKGREIEGFVWKSTRRVWNFPDG